MKRTYYVIEMGMATYPVSELRVSARPPADPLTRRLCRTARAETAGEAEQLVRDWLNRWREAALAAPPNPVRMT